METERLFAQFLYSAVAVLPWVLGGLGGMAILSFSPLGRGLLRYLREAKRDSQLTEALLSETVLLRQELAEVIERLDATEQRFARGSLPRGGQGRGAVVELSDADRTPTPR